MSRMGEAVAVLAVIVSACSAGQSSKVTTCCPEACPEALPENGSACPPPLECQGYSTSTNPCGWDCTCQGGAWTCETILACALLVEDASTDAAADAEGNDTSTFACASPQDCSVHSFTGPAVFCCIHDICIVGQAAEAQTCSDPGAQNITASSYDQSCETDSDCIAVEEGNFCAAGADNGCTNAAINKSALPQYNADLAKTQASVCFGLSGCPLELGPCCQNGTCQVGGQCFSAVQDDAGTDSGADAGPSDAPAGG
jgi:hypothetical protein